MATAVILENEVAPNFAFGSSKGVRPGQSSVKVVLKAFRTGPVHLRLCRRRKHAVL